SSVSRSPHPRYPRSFPTRRSSDLLNQITEIRADPRLEPVGPLPAPLQKYTNYAAGVVATGANHGGGKQLIDMLSSPAAGPVMQRSEEHTSELQSRSDLVCRLLLEK